MRPQMNPGGVFLAAILLLLLVILWPNHRSFSGKKEKVGLQAPMASGRARNGQEVAPVRSTRSGRRLAPVVANKTHEVDDLKNFYHPSILLEQATLSEGMAELLEAYRTICEETGETVLPLRWELKGSPDIITKLELKGDFLGSCRKLALHARLKFEVRDGTLVFSEFETATKREQKWQVPPTFVEHLSGLAGNSSGPDQGGPFEPYGANSSGDSPKTGQEEVANLSNLLKSMGILETREEVSLNPATGRLEGEVGPGSREFLSDLVRESRGHPPWQISYRISDNLGGEMRELPHIVAIPGQSASLESISEYVGGSGDEATVAWAGVKMSLTGELYGLGERTRFYYERIHPPSDQNLARFQETGRLADLDQAGTGGNSEALKTYTHRREGKPVEVAWSFRPEEGDPDDFPRIVIKSTRLSAQTGD